MARGGNRFLALGDSYTIGEGVAENERWPMRLAARLRDGGADIADPYIIARTGWTTAELAGAMGTAQPEGSCALVTLLIGVNDQYRGRALDEYRMPFRALLQHAIALARGGPSNVIVVSIPDWGVTPFAQDSGRDPREIAAQIDAFNAAAEETARRHGARFVDVTDISRDSRYRGLLIGDGLHPSGAQYAHWVDAIAPVAAEILRR